MTHWLFGPSTHIQLQFSPFHSHLVNAFTSESSTSSYSSSSSLSSSSSSSASSLAANLPFDLSPVDASNLSPSRVASPSLGIEAPVNYTHLRLLNGNYFGDDQNRVTIGDVVYSAWTKFNLVTPWNLTGNLSSSTLAQISSSSSFTSSLSSSPSSPTSSVSSSSTSSSTSSSPSFISLPQNDSSLVGDTSTSATSAAASASTGATTEGTTVASLYELPSMTSRLSSLIESSVSVTTSTFKSIITDRESNFNHNLLFNGNNNNNNIYMSSPLIQSNLSIVDSVNVTTTAFNVTNNINSTVTDAVGAVGGDVGGGAGGGDVGDGAVDSVTSANVQVFVLTLIFIAIVVGNVPIVITIIFGKLGKTRMYYFLLHLCFADLITGFFNVIPQLFWELTKTFHGGNILCKIIKYLQILGPYLSSFTLTAMSIDRFLAICHPLTNNHLSLYRAKRSISIAWSFSLALCLPQIFFFSFQQVNENDGTITNECWASFPIPPWGERIYVTWYAVSSFIIPFAIIFYTNFRICCELWKNSRERRLTGSRGISTCNTSAAATSCPKRIFRFTSHSSTTTTTIANVTINSGHASRSPSSSAVSFAATVEQCPSEKNTLDHNNQQQQQQQSRPSSLICESNYGDHLINVSGGECASDKLMVTTSSSTPAADLVESVNKIKTDSVNNSANNETSNYNSSSTSTATPAATAAATTTASRVASFLSARKGHKKDRSKEDKLHMYTNRNRSSTTNSGGEEVTHQLPSSPSETEFRVHRGGYNAGLSRISHQNKKNSVPSVEFSHIKRADGGSDLIEGTSVGGGSSGAVGGCSSCNSIACKGDLKNNSPGHSGCARGASGNCTHHHHQHHHPHHHHQHQQQQQQQPHHRSSFLSFLTLTSEGHNNRKESSSNSPSALRFSRCISQEDEHLRAKIKSVKLTVTVILCYVVCSSPFIFVQLWACWYPGAQESSYFTGPMVTIIMRMSSLNSCVNPWIYLTFNQKLYKALKKLFLTSNNEHSDTHRYSADMHVIFSC